MKKLKFIYFVLLSFGLILLSYSAEVNALEGWTYYEESPFSSPSIEDFGVVFWSAGGFHGVEGYWNFVVPFQLENEVNLDGIKVVVLEELGIGLYLDKFDGSPGYDSYISLMVSDYFEEMDVDCEMKLYLEGDVRGVDVSDNVYELMTTGYEFNSMHLLYPADDVVSRIDFVFEIDFHIDLTSLDFDNIDYNEINCVYALELYYNPNIYYDGYDDGFREGFWAGFDEGILSNDAYDVGYQDGFDSGFLAGLSEGILESDVSEAYQKGFLDGEKSKLAENNAAFYSGIGKWLVPAVITVIVLGGIVSIASIKRREQ